MPLCAVFFDVGEVLIDESRMWHGWADYLGIDRTVFLATLDDVIACGQHHRAVFIRLRPDFDLARAAHERERSSDVFSFEPRDIYPDVRPCLAALRERGLFVGFAGNQPPEAARQLQALGLGADLITTSAALGAEKPASAFFQQLLAYAGFSAGETLYVGDRIDNDVLPAHRIGMRTAFLRRGPWARHQASSPEAALADLSLADLGELPNGLGALR